MKTGLITDPALNGLLCSEHAVYSTDLTDTNLPAALGSTESKWGRSGLGFRRPEALPRGSRGISANHFYVLHTQTTYRVCAGDMTFYASIIRKLSYQNPEIRK
jgi:hypothetical protein